MRDPDNVFASREMYGPAAKADSSYSGSVSGKMKNRSDRKGWAAYSARSLLAAALVLMCGHIAWASTTGSISGTVRDTSGAVIPGVMAVAQKMQSDIKCTVVTDAQGFNQIRPHLKSRAEFFSVFSHAQFRAFSATGTINSSAFGLITATAAPRIGQLAVKFLFWRVTEHMEPVDPTVRGAL